jgi:hypothetical protein
MVAVPNHSADTPFNSITTFLTKIASDDVRDSTSAFVCQMPLDRPESQ